MKKLMQNLLLGMILLLILVNSTFGFCNAKKYCKSVEECNDMIKELKQDIKTLKKKYKNDISIYKKIITLYNKNIRENRNIVYSDGGFQRLYWIYRQVDKFLSKNEVDISNIIDILIY